MTISETTLQKAVADGLLTADLADRLRALEGAEAKPEDPERLRFISGFGDVFVVIGILLFTAATGFLVGMVTPWAGGLMFALANWGVAEYFTRKRRMALPSVISALLFALGIYSALLMALGMPPLPIDKWFKQSNMFLALGVCGILLFPYYIRFKTPIVPAMIFGSIFLSGYTYFPENQSDFGKIYVYYLTPIFGAIILIYAIRLDYLDPDRRTVKSDIAFWLHMLAATLIVHPVMLWTSLQYGDFLQEEAKIILALQGQTEIRLALILVILLIALLLDRRAILTSTLIYAFDSMSRIAYINNIEYKAEIIIFIILAVIGGLILLLSAGWYPIRQILLKIVPLRLRRLLPRGDARSYG